MGMLVVLGISSIFFFSTILIVAALMMRSHWDRIGDQKDQRPKE